MDEPGPSGLRALKHRRPRDRFLRTSAVMLAGVAVAALCTADFGTGELFNERRWTNVQRFVEECTPEPLRTRGEGATAVGWGPWLHTVFIERGLPGARATVAVAVAAIVLAGAGALAFAPMVARNVMTPAPFGIPVSRGGWWGWGWACARGSLRSILIIGRAVPEYIWGFIFLAVLGPQAWPLVLALAVHNFGLLGRLGSEAIEDFPPAVPARAIATGTGRSAALLATVLPPIFPRLMVFLFYRWETCLRDATVLGMLGFGTLGFYITDARARQSYDSMLVFVLLGLGVVLIGDAVSYWVRRGLRGDPRPSTQAQPARPAPR